MKRFKTNILIRNNRLKLMRENGLTVNYDILSDNDYIIELKKKIIEEAQEVFEAENLNDIKSELIDVMEVIDHLIEIYGFDRAEMNRLKQEKQHKIGKFNHKIKTNWVEMPDNHEEITYYESKPHKYPRIK